VSADGKVFSYTEFQDCIGGSACITRPSTSDSLLFIGGQSYGAPLAGVAQISRNGKLVLSALEFPGFTSPPQADILQLRDLQTATTYTVPILPFNRQALTSDGHVLGVDPQTWALETWSSADGIRALSTTEEPTNPIINDGGTWVVYDSDVSSTTVHLRALELRTGRDVLLATSGSAFNASISDDGTLVAYLAVPGINQPTQVFTIHTDGTGGAQLTTFPEGVDTAVLEGSGAAVFAVTGGRLVKIDTPGGGVQELIGPTPTCSAGFLALIPGSVLPFRGTGLANASLVGTIPLSTELAGVQVLADTTPLPLLTVSPTEVWFQVPFDMVLRPSVGVRLAHESVFEGCPTATVQVVSRYPYFLGTIVHQDFSGLITSAYPAHLGEWITAYAVGLGAVSPAIATGIPAPSDKLFPLAAPFECHTGYLPDGPPLQVGFAGLAPGLIGIYQVNVQMPDAPVEGGWLFVNCGTPGSATERHGFGLPISQ